MSPTQQKSGVDALTDRARYACRRAAEWRAKADATGDRWRAVPWYRPLTRWKLGHRYNLQSVNASKWRQEADDLVWRAQIERQLEVRRTVFSAMILRSLS